MLVNLVLAINKNLIYETLVINLFIVVFIYHLNKKESTSIQINLYYLINIFLFNLSFFE